MPSHGENRGSSTLGSASKINDLIAVSAWLTNRCLLFVYYPVRAGTKKFLWIGDRITAAHEIAKLELALAKERNRCHQLATRMRSGEAEPQRCIVRPSQYTDHH